MKQILILLCAAVALSATPVLAKNNGCPPGLAKKNPPCVPPGLAKKGVTSDDWKGDRRDDDERYHDDDDDDDVVYRDGDLPRYLVRPNGRVIDLRDRRDSGWRIVSGVTTEDGLPAFVIGPNGRIYGVESRLEDGGWQLVDTDDTVRLPTRDDGRQFYLVDDEVVEIIEREGDPYARLIGALDDILN